MLKRKWMITAGAFLLILLMATGYLAIAAEYGSKEDPLVTLSYITDVLSPDTLKAVEDRINQKATAMETELDTRLDTYSKEISSKISEFQSQYADGTIDDTMIDQIAERVLEKISESGAVGTGDNPVVSGGTGGESWAVITVASGKTLMLPLGAEVVLRIGGGTCYSTGSVGMVDLSSGTTIANGAALSPNHLYLVTISGGRGVKATSEMTALVKGSYTIE